ncbi:unnamed protein product [Albugo candida]|uniref:Uncharacterized protein n=1 Tax=Albugo candida TaxID=65357 RepID=A0A024GP20_9STRA|nr:unnamed protein product [Albugo candida]|eukprot:CCI48097.1 unnamed protein product [Albugo candida]
MASIAANRSSELQIRIFYNANSVRLSSGSDVALPFVFKNIVTTAVLPSLLAECFCLETKSFIDFTQKEESECFEDDVIQTRAIGTGDAIKLRMKRYLMDATEGFEVRDNHSLDHLALLILRQLQQAQFFIITRFLLVQLQFNCKDRMSSGLNFLHYDSSFSVSHLTSWKICVSNRLRSSVFSPAFLQLQFQVYECRPWSNRTTHPLDIAPTSS